MCHLALLAIRSYTAYTVSIGTGSFAILLGSSASRARYDSTQKLREIYQRGVPGAAAHWQGAVVMTVATDRTQICRDCGNEFVFTAGEQSFYAERGFVPPTRCAICRASRRAERQATRDDGSRPAPPANRQLFPAICADCGRETMVPFEPRLGRPVYCRDCFDRQREPY